jgi:hypothetical protein
VKTIDSKLLRKFLKLAGARLEGDWILIGGTVLPVLGVNHRVTTDIDLIGLSNPDQGQTLALMSLAEELGLPVESVNQAGAYFLEKIEDFRNRKVLLHRGKKASIFRPDATLFILLKIKRMSESDMADCLEWIKKMKKEREQFDLPVIRKAISGERKSASVENLLRLDQLALAIGVDE